MAQKNPTVTFDLSGLDGLSPRFYGDLPLSTKNPNERMLGSESMYAYGVVNPMSHFGYLSPANDTVKGATTTDGVISATITDTIHSFAFFFEGASFTNAGASLHRTQNFIDTSFGTDITITNAQGTDLEWYAINDSRALFYSYYDGTNGNIGVWFLDGVSGTGVNGTKGFLSYDTQTGDFTIGSTLTGGTSGATATILGDRDNGTTGTLILSNVSGTFQNAETITDADVGSAKANGGFSSVDVDFMSTIPVNNATLGNNRIQMRVADNGYMYILDGSSVHKFDGTTDGGNHGTLTANVLLFPAVYTLRDAIDYRGTLWITVVQSTANPDLSITNVSVMDVNSGVYVWDRQSSKLDMQDFIPIYGIRETRALFVFDNIPHLFTISNDRFTELRRYDGQGFKIIERYSSEAYPRFKDSVKVNGTYISWLGNDGMFYVYGKIDPKQSNNATYLLGDLSTHVEAGKTFSIAGAILEVNTHETASSGHNSSPEAYYFSLSNSTGGSCPFKKWYSHAYSPDGVSQNAHAGNFYSLVKILPKLSTTKGITVYFAPVTGLSGTTVACTFNIYTNQGTSALSTSITYDDMAKGYKWIPFTKRWVNSIQIGWTYPTNIQIINLPRFYMAELELSPQQENIKGSQT